MKAAAPSDVILDRFSMMGDLAFHVKRLLHRYLGLAMAGLVAATAVLAYQGNPGVEAFALMALGSGILLYVWRGAGMGLPLLPMLAVEHLIVYAMPIVTRNETVMIYTPAQLNSAGMEVLVFSVVQAAVWAVGMRLFNTAPPLAYALLGLERTAVRKLVRLGFGLTVGSSFYLLLQVTGLLDFLLQILPSGSASILTTVLAATSACGFFIIAMVVGTHEVNHSQRLLFWLLLTWNCVIGASGYLLSGVTTSIVAVWIGLFWGSGRMPWRYVAIVGILLSFFNIGKQEMRGRYWFIEGGERVEQRVNLSDVPRIYSEWSVASFDILADIPMAPGRARLKSDDKEVKQTILDRVNNLQNLLFAIDAVGTQHISTVDGATYRMIPALMIPRILWPGKPRTHEGQVLLNVHFGRQDLLSTYTTYVAWGLLPEAYGNFGPLFGSVFLGTLLGLVFAWLEKFTARKPIMSLEGFASFAIFLGMVNSYEMVASVLVTSIFDSVVPIVAACMPFVRRMVVRRPPPP